ncbi:MAG: phosphate ABC transporter substrate-binding protein PstS [Thermoproteota archaeon]|nr:phosphate ABC transporter substrate-binding protein PstS [Candidatus Brockarchaeota archaeon]MBO3801156.1 phosphate ABC transporter substrate-binding protein PstS [Candidatus Brockarchaeota archaeon]
MKKRNIFLLSIIAVIAIALVLTYNYYTSQRRITLLGAGATFPYPLIDKWSSVYANLTKGKVIVNYQPIGSGGGQSSIAKKLVDFAGSDAPLSKDQLNNASFKGVLHIPETIGAVVIAYNIPELKNTRLRIDGITLAKMYLGEITKWNDPAIAIDNPGINLPNKEIILVKRADASGTNYVFTQYLSAVSNEWKQKVGFGLTFAYPQSIGNRGLQGKGNPGVSAIIQQTPYSIGYIELAYALQNNITFALLKNKDGNFVDATIDNIKAAVAAKAVTLPKGDECWENVSLVNADGKNSYPIVSFTYILVFRDLSYLKDTEKAKALVDFLKWAVTDGQKYAPDLYYVPLPQEVVKIDLNTISLIKW